MAPTRQLLSILSFRFRRVRKEAEERPQLSFQFYLLDSKNNNGSGLLTQYYNLSILSFRFVEGLHEGGRHGYKAFNSIF